MRRSLVALAVAALCVLGGTVAPALAQQEHHDGAAAIREATAVARVAVAAVPAPQSSAPAFSGFAVLGGATALAAALLGYLARQRRRAVLVPAPGSAIRLRGPPATRVLF